MGRTASPDAAAVGPADGKLAAGGTERCEARHAGAGPETAARLLAVLAGASLLGGTIQAEPVVFSEIMFHPRPGFPEYIVLSNQTATPYDIAEWGLGQGISFVFPAFATSAPRAGFLKPHESLVLSAADAEATRAAYGWPASQRVLGPWEGELNDEGERISLQDKNGALIATAEYGRGTRGWAMAGGTGHSLLLANPSRPTGEARDWVASPHPQGGQSSPAGRGVAWNDQRRRLRLNEIHFGRSGRVDWVELHNPLAEEVELTDLCLAGSTEFSPGTHLAGRIPAGGFRAWELEVPPEEGRVRLFLLHVSGTVLDAGVWERPILTEGFQAFPDGAGEWYDTPAATRALPNSPARSQEVVINEIMYDPPPGENGGEYIELHNRGEKRVDLSGWELREAVYYKCPDGTVLEPGGFLVVAREVARMRQLYGEIPVVGDFRGKLSARGERIRLVDGVGNLADEVAYEGGGAWPELARGGGSSLELMHPRLDNSLASAWEASDESGKSEFRSFRGTNTYREWKALGAPRDYKELFFYLVGDGHVALRNLRLRERGRNWLENAESVSTNGSGDSGWLCQGTHWASGVTNGELHIVADGRGDARANRLEIDVPGLERGRTYEVSFEGRWVSGKPRLIMQSWDHSMNQSFLLDVPVQVGTPGRPNSRLRPFPPPQLDRLSHRPSVPHPTDRVRITVRLASPGAPAVLRLWHRPDERANGAAWSWVRMWDDGQQGGDDLAGDALYSAELKNYKVDGELVQFYVEAETAEGETARLPRQGADRPGLFVVDARDLRSDLRTVRLVVAGRDLEAFRDGHTAAHGFKFPRLSNHYVNTTCLMGQEEAIYGAEMRLRGSPLTRDGTLAKPKLKLPRDQPWRGRREFSYDDDAASGRAYHNRVARYLLYLVGLPANDNEFVRVIINAGPAELREEVEPVGNDFLDRHFDRGRDGDLYRVDDEWWFLDDWNGELRDAAWVMRESRDPGLYRHSWMKRTNETEDDYSALVDFFALMSRTNYSQQEVEAVLDAPALLRMAAVRGFIGDWDNFTMQRGRNGYFYRRPGDGLFLLLHWDSDEGFMTGPPLYGEFIKDWLEKPYNWPRFQACVRELVELTVREPARLGAWLELERDATGGTVFQAAYLNLFRARAAEVWPTISPEAELHVSER